MLLNSSRPAEWTLEALKKNVSPDSPLVMVIEEFRKGGYKTACNHDSRYLSEYVAIYPERVLSKTVITPDSDGLVVSVTGETTPADGAPPVVRSLIDDSVVTGPMEELCPDPSGEEYAEPEDRWDLAGWLDAQPELPMHLEDRGYTRVGASSLDGRPSIRYERQTPVSLSVFEFVEANPLLSQESRYTVQNDGGLVLEFQTTVVSVSAGE